MCKSAAPSKKMMLRRLDWALEGLAQVTRKGYLPRPPQGQFRFPTVAAMGGITIATMLMAIARGVEKKRTTNQATRMSPMHVPIRTK